MRKLQNAFDRLTLESYDCRQCCSTEGGDTERARRDAISGLAALNRQIAKGLRVIIGNTTVQTIGLIDIVRITAHNLTQSLVSAIVEPNEVEGRTIPAARTNAINTT